MCIRDRYGSFTGLYNNICFEGIFLAPAADIFRFTPGGGICLAQGVHDGINTFIVTAGMAFRFNRSGYMGFSPADCHLFDITEILLAAFHAVLQKIINQIV